MNRIFIGIDRRNPVDFHVLNSSIIRQSSSPVSVTPLFLDQLPIIRRGLTEFTYSRYLVPWLCDYEGHALFLDADCYVHGDINDIFSFADGSSAVQVVKHDMAFERPSVMLFDNSLCEALTPDFVDAGNPQQFEWTDSVGVLPGEWNHLVGYDDPNPHARIAHFTRGTPAFAETKEGEFCGEWLGELYGLQQSCSWLELLGKSVHAQHVMKKFQ